MYTCTCSGCIHCLHPKSLRLQFANAAGAAPYMSDAANIAPPGAVRSAVAAVAAAELRCSVLSATRQKPLLCKLICPVSQRSKMIKDQRYQIFLWQALKHIDTKDTCSCLWRNDTAMIAAVHHLNWDLVSSDSGLYHNILLLLSTEVDWVPSPSIILPQSSSIMMLATGSPPHRAMDFLCVQPFPTVSCSSSSNVSPWKPSRSLGFPEGWTC